MKTVKHDMTTQCDSASCEHETHCTHERGTGVYCEECAARRVRLAFDPDAELEEQRNARQLAASAAADEHQEDCPHCGMPNSAHTVENAACSADIAECPRMRDALLDAAETITRGGSDDRAAYEYARRDQGFTGDWSAWIAMPMAEREEYEEGATGGVCAPKTVLPAAQTPAARAVVNAAADYLLGRGMTHDQIYNGPDSGGLLERIVEAAAGGDAARDGREAARAWLASQCDGHPAGPHDQMGQTTYCDGTCSIHRRR
jgi:hypothetical protein